MKVRDLLKLWVNKTPSNNKLRLLLIRNADVTVKAYVVFTPKYDKKDTTGMFADLISSTFGTTRSHAIEIGLEQPLYFAYIFKSKGKNGKWIAVQNNRQVSLSTAIATIRNTELNTELQKHLEITADMKTQMLMEDL